MMFKACAISLFLTVSVFAGSPTDAVLRVLDLARKPNAKFEKVEGLARSPFIGPAKKRDLSQQWQSLRSWVDDEDVEFIKGFEKIDGDLAAVLVGAKSQLGPDGFRVLVFGARLIDGEWRVAPQEGSFANAGVGFEKSTKQRVRKLENWMMNQRVSAGATLLKQQRKAFREKMYGIVPEKELRHLKPAEVLQRFLKAARERRVEELFVWLGAMEQRSFPDVNWGELLVTTRKGIRNNDRQKVWRLLTDPTVVQVVAEEIVDEEESSSLLLFLSPYKTGQNKKRLQAVRFSFENHGHGWRVRLPGFFRAADQRNRIHWGEHNREREHEDNEMQDQFGKYFEESRPALRATSPEVLSDELLAAIEKRDLEGVLRRLHRFDFVDAIKDAQAKIPAEKGEDVEARLRIIRRDLLKQLAEDGEFNIELDGEFDEEVAGFARRVNDVEDQRKRSYLDAAEVFQELSPPAIQLERKSVQMLKKGPLAVSVVQAISISGGWAPQYFDLWMYEQDGKWSYLPAGKNTLGDDVSDELKMDIEVLSNRFEKASQEFRDAYLGQIMEKVARYDPKGQAIAIESANALVKTWRASLRKGLMPEVLQSGALFKDPAKPKWLLQDISYSIKAAQKAQEEDRFLGSQTKGRLCGVSLLVGVSRKEGVDCPLVIVVPTKNGGRVLLDVELWLPTNRGKEMRNADALESLAKTMNKEDFENLKSLMDWHKKLSRPAWEKWQKEREVEQNE